MALHRALSSTFFSKISEGIAKTSGITKIVGSPVIIKGVK
jgi:hypothetical protein